MFHVKQFNTPVKNWGILERVNCMTYVQPSGIIELFNGIKLDNRYMHTIYFANTSAQTNYFDSKVTQALTFNAQTYTRPNKQTVRLKVNNEVVQSCSYMRFNNRGNKWYYAFVLGTVYVNENVTDVIYEIDVMQTWFIQTGTIQPCFIERQHVVTDVYTRHLEAEPIGSDVYDNDQIENQDMDDIFASYSIEVFSSNAKYQDGDYYGAAKFDGIMTGGAVYQVANEASNLNTVLNNALGSWDKNEQSADIVDMYLFPSALMDDETFESQPFYVTIPTMFDSYTPQNKKMFSYPYSFLWVTNNNGDASIYRWEYFDNVQQDTDVRFDLNSCRVGGGQVTLHPHAYNGIIDNYNERLSITGFPKVSYSYDAYQAWIAAGGKTKLDTEKYFAEKKGAIANEKNMYSTLGGVATGSAEIAGGLTLSATGAGAGLMAAGSMTLANTIANAYTTKETIDVELEEAKKKIEFTFNDKRYEPDIVIGGATPSISVGQKYLGFKFYHCHVRDSEAKKIDNFLTTFGYAINDVATPNLSSRPYWNFIKTRDCQISGDMPASSRAAIGKIFNGGIFFWKNGDNVGNFTIGGFADGVLKNK